MSIQEVGQAFLPDRSAHKDVMRLRKQLHLGDLFHSRREPGKDGLPVTSVTMHGGLVQRDTLDRKSNGALTQEAHLLIRKGDIAYNMMRMWQGASGLAECDGVVSPAYVVVAPKAGIDPLFASYWFKSARMIHLFWAYSYGITGDRLRLYYKDFSRIPVTVPPKPEQERIGNILSTTDRAIAGLAKLIAAKRKLKQGLAQQLLTGQRRLPGCGEAWGKHEFNQLFLVTNSKKKQVQSTDYREWGCFPVVDQGKGAVAGYCDDEAKVYRNIPVIVFGDHTREVKYVNFPFVCGADGTQLLRTTELLHIEYGYQLLANHRLPSLGYSRHMSVLKEQVFRIPVAISEQTRIAAVLGAADRELVLLEKKLAVLRELKKGLMQRLLEGRIQQSRSGIPA